MAGSGSSPHLSATVSVVPGTFAKKLSFNTPVTPAECSTYLFGNATRAAACKPAGAVVGGKSLEFLLDIRSDETVMAMRDDIRNAMLQGGVLTSSAAKTERIVPLNGKVNVGGGGGPKEPAGYTNLNPLKTDSGGPSSVSSNHLLGSMEQMAELIQPQSVIEMISNRLRFNDVDWALATAAAATVMKPGGKVSMNVWCSPEDAVQLAAAFKSAGFKDVRTFGAGPGTMLTAVR